MGCFECVLFFSKEILALNQNYPSLFRGKTEDDEMDDEEEGGEGEDSDGDSTTAGFISEYSRQWGWLNMVKEVSDITRYNWDQVWEMNIRAFLGLVCFARDYNKLDMERAQGWQKIH